MDAVPKGSAGRSAAGSDVQHQIYLLKVRLDSHHSLLMHRLGVVTTRLEDWHRLHAEQGQRRHWELLRAIEATSHNQEAATHQEARTRRRSRSRHQRQQHTGGNNRRDEEQMVASLGNDKQE